MSKSYSYGLVPKDEIMARTGLEFLSDMAAGKLPQAPMCQTLGFHLVEVKEGFAIPAHGSHALARGGDHVMFLGLNRGLAQGDMVDVTLTFEKAGDVTIKIPVDLERQDGPGMPMGVGVFAVGSPHGVRSTSPTGAPLPSVRKSGVPMSSLT